MVWAVLKFLLLYLFIHSNIEVYAGDSYIPTNPIAILRSHPQPCNVPPNAQQTRSDYLHSNSSVCLPEQDQETFSRFNFTNQKIPFRLKNARNFSSLLNQGGSQVFQATNEIPLLTKHLTAGIQLAYRNPFLTPDTLSSNNRIGAQFTLKGAVENMRYRAEYGYSGPESGNLPISTPEGKIGGKFVWEWELPLVTPEIELSRFSDNVDSDPFRARTVSSNQTFSLNWSIPRGPQLRISYRREQQDIFSQPQGPLTDNLTSDSALAKFTFKHKRGDGFWSSRYLTSKNSFKEQGIRQEIGSTMGGTFRLSDPIDINPQVGIFRQTDSRQGPLQERIFGNLGTTFRLEKSHQVKPLFEFSRDINHQDFQLTDSFSAKLGYSYTAMDNSLKIAMTGQYVLNQTSLDKNTPQTYDVALFVQRDLHPYFHLPHRQQTLSLKISHNQRVDSFSSPTPAGQTTAMLLVSIAP